MSRLQQDQFVDDEEEECCPLCVEEFDLSDRNFRPCPCGYQICQFCYNNIKTTMNGLCPACRRPYDDSTIEWKTISPEEMAKHKQQIAQKAKKNAQIRQKEAQKAEADSLSRKHLAGLRVVQKNLVYVTGLTPTIREDRLLDTLRGPDYFGQYGKIIKIVVSKARENAQHQQSVGVYVTFARKEDAEQCIKAVDGSSNGDRQLRAQYGTTKYCSAYLRGEQCNNRNCMFLHEPGEDNDSFTRQDLSMMNSIQTQQPSQSSSSRPAPPAHPGPPVAAAAAPMSRQPSNDTSHSSHDAPGLPATASWGNKAVLERRASRSTIASNPSPLVTNATPAPITKTLKPEEAPKKKGKDKEKKEEKEKEKEQEKSAQTSLSTSPQRTPAPTPAPKPVAPANVLGGLLKTICSPDFKFVFSSAAFTEEELKAIIEFPQLLDPNGGAKRRAMREKEKELALQRETENEIKAPSHQTTAVERDDNEATAGGSLQLGGEPEDGNEGGAGHLNHHAIAPPGQQGFGGSLFGQNNTLTEDFSSLGLSSRGLTTQQQQQLLLSNFKSNSQSNGPLAASQNLQNQQHGLNANAPGHTRQTSRFTFANDSASASANVQPVANQKLMSQQNSMMPKNANHFGQMPQHQGLGGQFFTNVQGPPPGLKPTGTPPVGGTSMFGQGHGFATGGLSYGANAAGRNNSEAMYQDLLRSRNLDGGARIADAGKRESMFPSFLNQHSASSTPAPAPGLLPFPYGPSPGAYQDSGSQKSKKKGKKHRHANTSSSGGGGLADVQDPSILQARLHQGGMAGQGMYGQGQSGFSSIYANNNYAGAGRCPEEQVSFNVDALVNDTEPELEPMRSVPSPPMIGHFFTQTRKSTPTIPPGFLAPAIPRAMAEESKSRPGSRPMSRTTSSTITPAVPVVPVTPAKGKQGNQQADVLPITTTPPKPPLETPSQTTVKATPVKTPIDDTPVQKRQQPKVEEKKSAPVTPVREPDKAKGAKKNMSTYDTSPAVKEPKVGGIKDTTPSAATTPVASTKRQPPGKLDITAATRAPTVEQSPVATSHKTETQVKTVRAAPVTSTTSVPESPAGTVTGSPIRRTVAPRTLRVIPTPKSEVPPPLSAATPSLPQVPTVEKLRSRQASVASVNLPGTPIGEMISDTASVTSTSVSRANSPPLIGGKVGTAPVRKKTKSQAKKDRQERKKQIEEEMTMDDNKSDVEIVQAPIIGRKKKAKKPTTTPKLPAKTKSQPASPKPAAVEDDHSDAPTPEIAARTAPSAKTSAAVTPDREHFADTKEKRDYTAQAIMADLQKTGELLASTLEFFKPLSSSLTHASRAAPANSMSGPPDLKIHFSEADLEAIAKKKPVRLTSHDDKSDSRTLITPNGKFFWGLSEELEEKALQLEKQIEESRGHARFHPRKQGAYPHAHGASLSPNKDALPAIATALKEAGKKLGTHSTQQMPKLDAQSILNEAAREAARQAERLSIPAVQQSESQQAAAQPQQQTPADAGAYLNHFVLPKTDSPPPNQPRPEMAAVGGPPGAGTANISVHVGKFAKAAKAVVEGGAVGSTEIDGMGMMAADLLGGVFVQGLEALVGAGLGLENSQEFGLDTNGNIMIGRGDGAVSGGGGLDMQGLMSAIEGFEGGSRYGRGSVMSLEEAERAMHAAKREHEVLEKKLTALMKKNKKLFGGR
ncbi:transcriptional repressor general negative regulator of transcription subunit 4 [Pleosporales sp. CAS-2024a]